ncbi:MAG: hypothetical protein ACFFD4_25135, partial [Candidatus Odinarchaeota archaeon]
MKRNSKLLIALVLVFIMSLSFSQITSTSSGYLNEKQAKVSATTKRVVFTTHNPHFSPTENYSLLASYFTGQGYGYVDLDDEPSAALLATTDLLFVNAYLEATFSETAITTIEDYVLNGGGLIMVIDSGGLDFGLKMSPTPFPLIGTHSLDIFPGPVTNNVVNPVVSILASISTNIALTGTAIPVVNTTASSHLPNKTVIAISDYGKGKIMACTVNIWDDDQINNGDNKLLIGNYLDWLSQEGTKKAVFTKNQGYYSTVGNYSKLANYMASEGFMIDELKDDPDAALLATTDLLFVNNYQLWTDFSPATIAIIEDYVFNGGGLITVFDSGGLDFGLKMDPSVAPVPIGTHSFDIFPGPVTFNVLNPSIPDTHGIVDIELNGTAIPVVNTTDSSYRPNKPAIATNYYGEGKIMACAIASIWHNDYWTSGDNKLLIENYLKWISEEDVKLAVFTDHNVYFSPTGSCNQLANYFASQGYIIMDLTEDPSVTLLTDTDLLFVNSYQRGDFSPATITAIEDYVFNGGRLIMGLDTGGLDFGLKMTTAAAPPIGTHSLYIFPSPVAYNVVSLSIPTDTGITGIDLSGTAIPVVNATAGSGLPNKTVIATNYYGTGKIMACTDPNIWDDTNLNDGDNKLLIENFLKWISQEDVKRVVFGLNNGYFSIYSAYSELANYLAGQGYFIHEMTDDANVSLLAGADLLFMNSYQVIGGYSAAAVTAIEDYIYNGGGLILASGFSSLGFISSYGPGTVGSYGLDIFSHPVTHGIADIALLYNSGFPRMTLSGSARAVVMTDSSSDAPDRVVLAVNHHGQGKLMATAVAHMWTNGNFNTAGNTQTIQNFLDWLNVNTTFAPPSVTGPADLSYNETDTGNEIIWNTNGFFPYQYLVYKNDTLYSSGTWSTVPVMINVDGLQPGTYNFTIIVI